MSDPQGLGKLTRWVEGGAVVTLVSAATAGVPVAALLAGGREWAWYAAPFVSGLLLVLAVAIDLRSRNRAKAARPMRLPPDVVRAARERFAAPGGAGPTRGPAAGVSPALREPDGPRDITDGGVAH
jgi:hypothetical protein